MYIVGMSGGELEACIARSIEFITKLLQRNIGTPIVLVNYHNPFHIYAQQGGYRN
jgi:hypothetical protein